MDNQQITEMLPILIPLIVVQLILAASAVIHILRHKTYRCGNRVLWLIVSLVCSMIGPILYFVLGRSDDEED